MDSSTAASTNNNADGSAKAKTAQPRVCTIVKTIVPEYFTKLPLSEAWQHLVKLCQAYPELVTHIMKFPKDEVDSNNNEHFWCIRTVKGDDDTTLLKTEFVLDQLRKIVTHFGYQRPITVTDAMTALQLIMDDPQMAEDFEEQFKQSTATPVEKSSRAIFRIVKLFFR
jgi:hypothetical protein